MAEGMDVLTYVERDLHIPGKRCKRLSPSSIIALVSKQWAFGQSTNISGTVCSDDMDDRMCCLCLSPSYTHIPEPWIKVSIQLVRKQVGQVNRLPSSQHAMITERMGYAELLTAVSSLQSEYNWSLAHHQYKPGQHTVPSAEPVLENYNDVIRRALSQLYGPSCVLGVFRGSSQYDSLLPQSVNHNVYDAMAVLESETAFYVIHPSREHTLFDLLHFSPCAVYENSSAKPLFFVYQILRLMSDMHSLGLSVGSLSPHHLLVNQDLWISVHLPCEKFITNLSPSEGISVTPTDQTLLLQARDICPRDLAPVSSLSDLIRLWVHKGISNYQYLMCLNYLAGRRLDSPNHHPILPWLTDFSSPCSGYRDLSKSKYRLNKGDDQLDLTYETDPCIGSLYPHHISDFLSDITYYVYEARRTPKQVLCTHVRRKWVPHEYPTSLRRIYDWTPDECIPAFFTDPDIFRSIHEDLDDLQLPEWCPSPEEFVNVHMQLLESERVSSQLNEWIDLTFGYKLTGRAAVAAKNVCLQLVNHHTRLTNHGVLQLFTTAHPSRAPLKENYWANQLYKFDSQKDASQGVSRETERQIESLHAALQVFGETISPYIMEPSVQQVDKVRASFIGVRYTDEQISLPDDFDPLRELNNMEKVYEFTCRNVQKLPRDNFNKAPPKRSAQTELAMNDINELTCFLAEVMMAPKLRLLDPDCSLYERHDVIQCTVRNEWRELPRSVRSAMHVLLNVKNNWNSQSERMEDDNMPRIDELHEFDDPYVSAGSLLHPATSFLPFPPHFRQLYSLISELKSLDHRIHVSLRVPVSDSSSDKPRISCSDDSAADLYREKLLVVNEILIPILPDLDSEAVELVLPYIVELFSNEKSTVSAAWLLFNHIGRALGPKETAKHFLPPLIGLYNGENASKKHLKLYERSFLRQLYLRLGLHTFLAHFSTLLVEAAGAYRDFPCEEVLDTPSRSIAKESSRLSTATIESEYQMKIFGDDQRSRTSTKLDAVMEIDTPWKQSGVTAGDSDNDLESMTNSILIHYEGETASDVLFDRTSVEDSEDDINKSESSSMSGDDDSNSCSENSDQLAHSSGHPSVYGGIRLLSAHSVSMPSDADGRPPSTSSVEEDGDQDNGPGEGVGECKLLRNPNRRERQEFTQAFLENDAYKDECNVCNVACESIKWICLKIGPLLTAKFFARNLLRMLNLCYVGEDQVVMDPTSVQRSTLPASDYHVVGDRNSHQVIQCLAWISTLYGEQVILLQYIPYVKDVISAAHQKFKNRSEAGLVGCLALIQDIIPYMTDGTFMESLQPIFFQDILLPIIRLASSKGVSFSGGSKTRQAIFFKTIDILYIIGMRIGFELTRQMMTPVLQRLFASFDRVYGWQMRSGSEAGLIEDEVAPACDSSEDNVFCEIKKDSLTNEYKITTPVTVNVLGTASSWQNNLSPSFSEHKDVGDSDVGVNPVQQSIMKELRDALTPELAHTAYITFCKLAGGIYMDEKLTNHDLIRQLCSQHDDALSKRQVSPDTEQFSDDENGETGTDADAGRQFGTNVHISGNRILVDKSSEKSSKKTSRPMNQLSALNLSSVRNEELQKNRERHLKGNWLAYWEHELGLNERSAPFNFKQIKLQTYQGHTNCVRAITVMDAENAFMTASKDRTVKLWSIQNTGDGQVRHPCKWTYEGHRKSVFAVSFMESARVALSCDNSVHIWDPFVGMGIRQMDEGGRFPAICALTPVPAPSTQAITATTDGTLRFLDVRIGSFAHEFKCTYGTAGHIKSVSVSPNTHWVAVGYSTGVISILDVRTGFFLKAWKGHESEILQIKAFDNNRFLTSSLDQTIVLWNKEDGRVLNHLKGHTEAAICFTDYKNEVISATATNKVGVHSSVDCQPCEFTSTKLRSDTFKGVLTTMAVLPLNRQLLLGADNGTVRLLC